MGMMPQNKWLLGVLLLLLAGASVGWLYIKQNGSLPSPSTPVTDFEECVAAGNAVMESYPRQCRHEDKTYTENIGDELEKANLIRITTPRPNQTISSPVTITGEARGNWYFEASFPVMLEDASGNVIARGIATAQSEWMTTEFVPFVALLTFAAPETQGTLVLHKDNPSGLPEHDDMLRVPVIIAKSTGTQTLCTQEALQCPDGSYVGRTGPNCAFAPCPR